MAMDAMSGSDVNPKKIYHGGYAKEPHNNAINGTKSTTDSSIVPKSQGSDFNIYKKIIEVWMQSSQLQLFQVYQLYLQHDVIIHNRFIEIKNTKCSVSMAFLRGTPLNCEALARTIAKMMLKQYTLNETWRCTSKSHPKAFHPVYLKFQNRCAVPAGYHKICTIQTTFVQWFMNVVYLKLLNLLPTFQMRDSMLEEATKQDWECTFDVLDFIIMVTKTFQLTCSYEAPSDYHLPGSPQGLYFMYSSHKALVSLCLFYCWHQRVSDEWTQFKNKFMSHESHEQDN